MTVPRWRAALVTTAFIAVAAASVAPVDAACVSGTAGLTQGPQGDAWLGTFVKTYGPESDEDPKDLWGIGKVYVGDVRVVDDTMIYKQDLFVPPRFEDGARYLVTTADWTEPTIHDTVAWRIGDDDSVRLVTFLPLSAHDGVYRVSTLREALGLVLRGELPQTDAPAGSGDTPGRPTPGFLDLATSIVADAFVLWRWLLSTWAHS